MRRITSTFTTASVVEKSLWRVHDSTKDNRQELVPSTTINESERRGVGSMTKENAMSVLTQEFYERTSEQVARELIGKHLVRRTAAGMCRGTIVETEAYLADGDSASHSYRGLTRKNATMFRRGCPCHS